MKQLISENKISMIVTRPSSEWPKAAIWSFFFVLLQSFDAPGLVQQCVTYKYFAPVKL